jgi:hypothetical protein
MGRVRSNKLQVKEIDVQCAVVDMLSADGWRAIRTDPVSNKARGTGFGEISMPDFLFLRYWRMDNLHNDTRPIGEMFWIEFKAPGKVPNLAQLKWHGNERNLGALVLVVDNVDDFREFYKTSGLMRHPILS